MQAALSGVQGHLIIRVEIDALYDVYLAVIRPQRTFRPERGPYRAAVGYVQKVDDPETTVVVEVLRGYANLCHRKT